MGRWKELKGNQYGHLYVLEDFHGKGNLHYCKCICDCENHTIKNVRACHLLAGAIDNCGCVTKERLKKSSTHHGMKFTRFYMTWQNMKDRCHNKNSIAYSNYGGRGITYCERWEKFENFRDDMYESYIEHCKQYKEKDTFIDRIDVNGNYCKENCRWVTRSVNNNNKRNTHMATYMGVTDSVANWCRKLNLNYKRVIRRITDFGYTFEEAITIKAHGRKKHVKTR